MFKTMKLGPFIGIQDVALIQSHFKDILDRGFIPHTVITNPQSEEMLEFAQLNPDFNAKALIVTIYYTEFYE